MPPLSLPDPELAVKLLAPWALRTLELARLAPIAIKGRTWNLVSYALAPEQVAS